MKHPSLYQMNTRVRLTQLSGAGRATLDDLPDSVLSRLAELGFDWLWLLGVWQTGDAGREVSRTNPAWIEEFERTLPDLSDEDICGSCFAVQGYVAHANLGGDAALERLRARAREHGLRLMLDFVPNHVALDHPWVREHPEYFVSGTGEDLAREPQNYVRVDSADGPLVLAHGRDPSFDGWPDTLQLNYAEPGLRTAMLRELEAVADRCDGVRCDMAMLIEPEVFERTWGTRPEPFWPEAIERVRARHPDFLFMAEVYWDMEWTLQQRGFDYTYDKRLYDRLREGNATAIRGHLSADAAFQGRLARFLENHDEPRAATAFDSRTHRAAAIVTYLSPGLRFLHEGQLEGRTVRIPPHLCRGPDEAGDPCMRDFYRRLLECLKHETLRNGDWRQLECTPAAQNNRSWDGFIAGAWDGPEGNRILVAVNYSPRQGQCRVRLPDPDLAGRSFGLTDLMGPERYDREGDDLVGAGLYLDLPPWGFNVFELGDAGSSPHS